MAVEQCIIWPDMEMNVIYCGDNLDVVPNAAGLIHCFSKTLSERVGDG